MIQNRLNSFIINKFRKLSTISPTNQTTSCTARFPPNLDYLLQASTVKHLHFTGLKNYKVASKVQNYIVDQHLKFKVGHKNSKAICPIYPTILTFEFESVYTGGKRERDPKKATSIPVVNDNNNNNNNNVSDTRMTNIGVPYVQTDRGGQVTYHGPGQLVAYFIWDLKLWKNLTSKCFVNFIEKSSLDTISATGLENVCTTENTGVWISKNRGNDDKYVEKISSIGLNLKRNVTSHGLSINLNPDLKYLNNPHFVMCGLEGYKQTSIQNENDNKLNVSIDQLCDILCDHLRNRMNTYMMNAPGQKDYEMTIEKLIIAEDENDWSLDSGNIQKLIDNFISVKN